MSDAHQELDRLVGLAGEAGWAVHDDRRTRCVLWFARGDDYVHVGVNTAGEMLSLYGGVHGRPARYWAASRDAEGQPPDRLEILERALLKQEGKR